MISFEDCVEMAKAKLNYFIQSRKTCKPIEIARRGLRRLLANLKDQFFYDFFSVLRDICLNVMEDFFFQDGI